MSEPPPSGGSLQPTALHTPSPVQITVQYSIVSAQDYITVQKMAKNSMKKIKKKLKKYG